MTVPTTERAPRRERGGHAAAYRLSAWLHDDVPRRLTAIAAREGIDPITPPYHVVSDNVRRLGIEEWPAILTRPVRQTAIEFVDTDGEFDVYAVTYLMSVMSWVRAEDYEPTAVMRDRYALAVREAILARRQLTAAPLYGEPITPRDVAWIKAETIREDYSDVTVAGSATIAGVETLVELVLVEHVEANPTVGTFGSPAAEVVKVPDTAPLPPHPALGG